MKKIVIYMLSLACLSLNALGPTATKATKRKNSIVHLDSIINSAKQMKAYLIERDANGKYEIADIPLEVVNFLETTNNELGKKFNVLFPPTPSVPPAA